MLTTPWWLVRGAGPPGPASACRPAPQGITSPPSCRAAPGLPGAGSPRAAGLAPPSNPSFEPPEGFIECVCPSCGGGVVVQATEVNCAVFRHGAYRAGGMNIDPHAPKATVDALLAAGAIFGCGAPFRLLAARGGIGVVEACGFDT